MDVKQTVLKKIGKMGYDVKSFSEKEIEYIMRIETVISEIFDREAKARELLTNNHLSINSISQKANIARQTLYNNSILLEYIEFRSVEFKDIDISIAVTDLNEKVKTLNHQVEEMMKRDSELEEMKSEIKTLKNKLKDKEQELMRFYKPTNMTEKN